MSFTGTSPKMIARDIADGYILLTMANVRKYSEAQIRVLSQNITIVEREIRAEQFEPNDTDNVKKKHMRLQRLFRAKTLVNEYAKKWKIQI
jgi:hypothetical protein